ncbi:MAG TPA: class I adenylate-forming enzyme family protein [Tepidisphaeraceae bacterium]|nr:class I adenylate-forming enzyme family protein [Tepidisphaeraceae bacterium]
MQGWQDHATIEAMELLERVFRNARERPGATAVAQVWPTAGPKVSFAALTQAIEALANQLKAALPGGAVVMVRGGNSPQYLAAYLAVLQAGMTVFPLPADLAGREMVGAAQRSGAAAMICLGDFPIDPFGTSQASEILGARAVFATQPNETPTSSSALGHPTWKPADLGTSMLLLSSGTTATPKIVRRDAAALDAVSRNMVGAMSFAAQDIVLSGVPLCHSYGVEHGLLAPMWAGSEVRLCDGFDPQACLVQLAHDVTVFPGVPFMYEMLCEREGQKLPRLRIAYSAGGSLPMEIARGFEAKYERPVSQLYGASEIGSVTYNDPAVEPFDPRSVGRAMDGVEIRIIDAGEARIDRRLDVGVEGHVAIRATSRMSGYVGEESSPFVDGFFLTGDLGRLHESRALTLTGRIKLLIDIGGRKVNPLEIEQVMQSHPDVSACVVVPMRASQTLFRLKAIVTPAERGKVPDLRELRVWAKERLSAYKVPRVFEVRHSLPRSATGKVLRHVLETENSQ